MMETAKTLTCCPAIVGLMFHPMSPVQLMKCWFHFTQITMSISMDSTSTSMKIPIFVNNGLITRKAPSSHQHFRMKEQTNLTACG